MDSTQLLLPLRPANIIIEYGHQLKVLVKSSDRLLLAEILTVDTEVKSAGLPDSKSLREEFSESCIQFEHKVCGLPALTTLIEATLLV